MEGVTVLPLANYRDPDRLESPGQIEISGFREPSFFPALSNLVRQPTCWTKNWSALVFLPEPQPVGLGHP